MTPEQEARFRLVNVQEPTVNIPGQMMTQGMQAESVEVDVVSQGLARSISYMANNGPVRPVQKVPARVMTQHQLEEQKMNEAQGLPSNLEEASRVVALEGIVTNLNESVGKMSRLLSQVIQGQPSNAPATQPPIGVNPTSAFRNLAQAELIAQPLTPPARLAAPLNEPVFSNPPAVENQQAPLSTLPDPAMGTPTFDTEPPTLPPDSSQLRSLPPASPETIHQNDENIQEFGGAIARPTTVTLGPSGSGGIGPDEARYELTEEFSPGESEEVATEPTPPPVDVVEMKRLSRQQMLTEQVSNWLKSKDTHKFWRQFIAGACNKNLSYNTWPPEFQGPFNVKFKEMIEDPAFVSVLCGRITKMQMGHLVAPHVAGAFVVVSAGFLSFALLEQ